MTLPVEILAFSVVPKCFAFFLILYVQLISLDVRNQELAQEMEKVRSELVKAKTESENLLKEEKKANQNEMEKVRLELERALKKMSKSEAHDELLKVQLVNNVSVILKSYRLRAWNFDDCFLNTH